MAKGVKMSRAERGAATRARILSAAREEFISQGYPAALMASIAERAGVSVQMLYFAFGTKARLFLAVEELAVTGEEGLPPEQTPGWAAALEEPTAQGVIAAFVRGVGEVFRRAAPLSVVARVAAGVEEEVASEGALADKLREDGYRSIVRAAAQKGRYLPGLDEDGALDLLMALYSPTFYVELTQERGWPHERAIEWLASTLPGLIFEDDRG